MSAFMFDTATFPDALQYSEPSAQQALPVEPRKSSRAGFVCDILFCACRTLFHSECSTSPAVPIPVHWALSDAKAALPPRASAVDPAGLCAPCPEDGLQVSVRGYGSKSVTNRGQSAGFRPWFHSGQPILGYPSLDPNPYIDGATCRSRLPAFPVAFPGSLIQGRLGRVGRVGRVGRLGLQVLLQSLVVPEASLGTKRNRQKWM